MSAAADDFSSGSRARPRTTEAEWDKVRAAFRSSIMVTMSLNSLAQNLDIAEWPIEGPEQVPQSYLDLTFDELLMLPTMARNPERVDLLVSILRETLAFDEPFGEMVDANVTRDERENPLLKNLARLEIPEDFPMSLVALAADTREFCGRSNLATLKAFALFGQNLSQAFIVAGDFRALLNALSHIDEATLAMYLPFRPGSKGLHLFEGVALLVRAQPAEVQAGLAKKYGARLGQEDADRAVRSAAEDVVAADELLRQQAPAYIEYFADELGQIQKSVDEGEPLPRLVAVLADPLLEIVVVELIRAYIKTPAANAVTRKTAAPLQIQPAPRKRGFLGRIFRLFRE